MSGDGISTGAGVNGAVAGVLQGEKAATRNFTGDNTSVVFPLTTVALTAASIVNFNATVTSGGVSVLALGRTAVDRNGDGVVNATDVYTGSSATNSVSDLTTAATQATILSLAANSADSVSIAAGGGTTRIDLSAKPVDLDGNFRFTANGATSGDIVSITVRSGDATALPFSVTGDSPGIATGGAIIVKIEPFTACSTACVTVTTTYLRYSAVNVAATTLTIASALTNAEAKAAAGWNGKIPRDAGLARATPAADGTYNGEDLTVVVDGRTLSSADYSFSIAGANAHFLLITNVTAQNTPNAAANNVIVSLKYTEFDGSILGGATSIPTPFGTVTATAGPTFATQ